MLHFHILSLQSTMQINIFMEPKLFFLREEIPIADELLSYAPKLLEEFLAYHTDFIDGNFSKGHAYVNAGYDVRDFQSSEAAWKMDGFKFAWRNKNIYEDHTIKRAVRNRYPTACAMLDKFGAVAPVSAYSILEKNNIIKRHIGRENDDGKYIRIHVPLLVPEGDIFLECEGVEIDWSDIYGFANQYIHSAHNYSDQRRLVFLIDVEREYLGLPPPEELDYLARMRSYPPFVRGEKPKQYHSKQLKP